MSEFWKIILGAGISLTISGIGWYLLGVRAHKTSKRSETFSLLTPTISLLSEFQTMAEDAVKVNTTTNLKQTPNIHPQQVFETKFHSKFNLLRTKLDQLNTRNINIANKQLIDLKKAYTLNPIDNIFRYKSAIEQCHIIEVELYRAFEREYNSI